MILETDLNFSSHVKSVTKSAYYHLKNIARIRSFVSSQDLEKLVHAFITSRVDYCNGLLTGLPKKTIRQLQLIQNTAARILTRTRKYEHITPVLRSLHWLPVRAVVLESGLETFFYRLGLVLDSLVFGLGLVSDLVIGLAKCSSWSRPSPTIYAFFFSFKTKTRLFRKRVM